MIGIGLGITQRRRGVARIITAIIAPFLAPLTDGDTVASALSADIDQTTNYASTEGTIASVVVEVLVNGVAPPDLDTPLDFEDVVSVTVTVTDSEANTRVFNAGVRTVAGIAPTNDVAPSIAGDTGLGDALTVTAGTWFGVPTPTLAYQWLRDGAEIAGETGTTYEITLADSGALITVRETATNAEGSASAVSNAITADTFAAPDAFTAPDWDVATDGDTVSVNIITLPNDGGSAITDLEYRVNAGAAVSLGETTTGSYPITADEGDDIQIRAVNAVGAGDWSDVKAVPAGETFDPDALAYITAVETADGEALEAGVKDAINDFVVGCKADAIWDALKATCILAGARTLNGCLVPLTGAAPTNFNFVSADYDRKTGLKGDGSTKYLDSNRLDSADPQDNHHIAYNMTNADTVGEFRVRISAGFDAGKVTEILQNSSATPGVLFRSRKRDGPADEINISGAGNTLGFQGLSRASSSSFAARLGGTTTSASVSSLAAVGQNYEIFSRPGGSSFNDARLSFYSIGESLDLAALDTRVSNLMTALDEAIA